MIVVISINMIDLITLLANYLALLILIKATLDYYTRIRKYDYLSNPNIISSYNSYFLRTKPYKSITYIKYTNASKKNKYICTTWQLYFTFQCTVFSTNFTCMRSMNVSGFLFSFYFNMPQIDDVNGDVKLTSA